MSEQAVIDAPECKPYIHDSWRRPRRSMRSVKKVAEFWAAPERAHVFQVSMDRPECFACGLMGPDWTGWLQRAHLVTRCYGGLDHEGNLALLCEPCHADMPDFHFYEGCWAIEWVRASRFLVDTGALSYLVRTA